MLSNTRAALRGAALCCTLAAAMPQTAAATSFLGRAESTETVTFDVFLPLRDQAGMNILLRQLHDPKSPLFHQWLTPAEFGQRFGPPAATVARVASALRARGFQVTPQTRSLEVTGSAALVEASFGARLMVAQAEDAHTHIVADGDLHLPSELAAAGAAIWSFAPQVAHFNHSFASVPTPQAAGITYSATGPYWFDGLKQAYSYPSPTASITVAGSAQKLDGAGATVGIVISSDVNDSDIKAMFDHENWSTVSGTPDPTLYKRVLVNGGGGLNTSSDAFEEASLDTQQALGGAPGAHVILYNIPSLSTGSILAGWKTVVEQNEVQAVSASFGGCELAYFPQYNNGTDYRKILLQQHELFLQGNMQGISFLVSSGDAAGKTCPSVSVVTTNSGTFVKSVENPASDPNVTAVGGTNLITNYSAGSLNASYASEQAWSDPEVPLLLTKPTGEITGGVWGAGGGYSQYFKQPEYQQGLGTGSKWRAIPDIGMQVGGCPESAVLSAAKTCNGGDTAINGKGDDQRSYVEIALNVGLSKKGGYYGVIGTSVAAPEFLGAMAVLLGASNSRLGDLNSYLYSLAHVQAGGQGKFYHTGIPGYNGVQKTAIAPAYSLSTGVGTPIVSAIVGAYTAAAAGAPVAGVPQTASNP